MSKVVISILTTIVFSIVCYGVVYFIPIAYYFLLKHPMITYSIGFISFASLVYYTIK